MPVTKRESFAYLLNVDFSASNFFRILCLYGHKEPQNIYTPSIFQTTPILPCFSKQVFLNPIWTFSTNTIFRKLAGNNQQQPKHRTLPFCKRNSWNHYENKLEWPWDRTKLLRWQILGQNLTSQRMCVYIYTYIYIHIYICTNIQTKKTYKITSVW